LEEGFIFWGEEKKKRCILYLKGFRDVALIKVLTSNFFAGTKRFLFLSMTTIFPFLNPDRLDGGQEDLLTYKWPPRIRNQHFEDVSFANQKF
jgi:hypothetical protein